ncbi:hypothetical protein HFD88_002187 [Aspergillus terreus]|nr:hypothetical protein HFD88_002187 [Aspergillus terreus]
MLRTPPIARRLRPFRLASPFSSTSGIVFIPHSGIPIQAESKECQLSPQNLEIAIRSLYHDGLVVVENVKAHDAFDRLNEKRVQDAYYLQSKTTDSPYNYNPGNIQQDLPPVRKYFGPAIFLSKPLSCLSQPRTNKGKAKSAEQPTA